MGDFRTSFCLMETDQPTENWNDVLYVKKSFYTQMKCDLILQISCSWMARIAHWFFVFCFFFSESPQLWKFHHYTEPLNHTKEHATRTTQWMVPPHVKGQPPDELATSLTHTHLNWGYWSQWTQRGHWNISLGRGFQRRGLCQPVTRQLIPSFRCHSPLI